MFTWNTTTQQEGKHKVKLKQVSYRTLYIYIYILVYHLYNFIFIQKKDQLYIFKNIEPKVKSMEINMQQSLR